MENLKEKLKELISSFDYIPKKAKEEWFLLLDDLDEERLKFVYENFRDMEKKETQFMVDTLIKNGRGEDLLENNEELLREFKRETMKKREQFAADNEERPEDVLNKLKDL